MEYISPVENPMYIIKRVSIDIVVHEENFWIRNLSKRIVGFCD